MRERVYRGLGQLSLRFAVNVAVVAMLAVYSSSVLSAGSKKAGAKKARACQVCHGKGGQSSNPTYPVLAGQHAKYIVKQLKAFKSGTRKDPIMNGMASTLSEQDMEDVAAFFQSKGQL